MVINSTVRAMFKNYLIIAFRNLLKTRQFSLINILGLSIGMTAFLVILHYVSFEKSYDKFYTNSDRIYRLRYERYSEDGESVRFASCCPPAGLRIRKLLPEVELVARICHYPASVSYIENRFIEERLFYAEPDFFKIFKFKFIDGDPANVISEPNTALISRSTARKYFGEENPMGKSIKLDNKTEYQITGVFEDIPENSHIKFDIVLPWTNLLDILGTDFDDSWGDSGAFTYILFKKGVDIADFQKKLDAIAEKEFGEALRYYKLTMTLPLQSLTDIHLTSHFQQELEPNGDRSAINPLLAIAFFIMGIAWVNYINLSTARSLTRAKEVGLRKVVGASRAQLIIQFFLEVFIMNLIAIGVTILLLALVLPILEPITGTPVTYGIWNQNWLWIVLFLLLIAGVLLSGLYPVALLSSFRPLQVLKGKIGNNPKGLNLRKVLVVFQFTMALCLITFTLAVFLQISFMKNMNLGFNIEQVLVVRAPRVREANFNSSIFTFKQEILKNPVISHMSVVTEVPGRQIYWDAGGIFPVGSDESKNYQIVGIDYDFVDLFHTPIIAGRNFSASFPSDTMALILNETAVKWMGFANPDSAVGQQVNYWDVIYTVIGVMEDYHQQSPKVNFEPHIYRFLPYGRGVRGMFAFKLRTRELKATVNNIQQFYDRFFPGNPFEYFFLDDYFNKQYQGDLLVGKVFGLFSLLAVFVTALGIYGLFSFLMLQRTREICIRNIMGAGTPRILFLFSRELLLLIITAFLISLALCYIGIDRWLNSFANKMPVTPWLFILPLVLVVFVTGLTMGIQVIKVAKTNPADYLRYE
jgi:putative ABC transport system permease protein